MSNNYVIDEDGFERFLNVHIRDVRRNVERSHQVYEGFLKKNQNVASFMMHLRKFGLFFRYTIKHEEHFNRKSTKSHVKYSFGKKIPYFGHPFVVEEMLTGRCMRDENNMVPVVRRMEYRRNTRRRASRKCEGIINIISIKVFPEIEPTDSARLRRKMCSQLRPEDASEHCKYVQLSILSEHQHPVTMAHALIHPALKMLIRRRVERNEHVYDGIEWRARTLRAVVDELVARNEVAPPPPTHSFYYPPPALIDYHTRLAVKALRKDTWDVDVLADHVERWILCNGDSLYFQPKCKLLGEDILLCHQTKWQMNLLSRYGNIITYLDAAYSTIDCDFPVYFLSVKTNSGFAVVATIILNVVSVAALKEALSMLKSWNKTWNPVYVVLSNPFAECDALRHLFATATLLQCEQHRERHWWRFLAESTSASENDRTETVTMWRRIAESNTCAEMDANVAAWESSRQHRRKNVRHYFTKKWYKYRSLWINFFHNHDYLTYNRANNTTEMRTEFFQHKRLYQTLCDNRRLSNFMRVVVDDYLPSIWAQYNDFNLRTSVPLSDAPHLDGKHSVYISHFMHSMELAAKLDECRITAHDKTYLMDGFIETDQRQWHLIDLERVRCTCVWFERWRIPCQHMCALFRRGVALFLQLPEWYRECVYFTIDVNYLTSVRDTYIADTEHIESTALMIHNDDEDMTMVIEDDEKEYLQSVECTDKQPALCKLQDELSEFLQWSDIVNEDSVKNLISMDISKPKSTTPVCESILTTLHSELNIENKSVVEQDEEQTLPVEIEKKTNFESDLKFDFTDDDIDALDQVLEDLIKNKDLQPFNIWD